MRNLVMAILVLVLPVGSAAATITLSFSGTVGGGSYLPGPLASYLSQGSPVTGTITYDSTVPDSDSLPGRGLYVQDQPGLGIDVWLGSVHVFSDPVNPQTQIQVYDNQDVSNTTVDRFAVFSSNHIITPSVPYVPYFEFLLTDSTASVFNDESLPTALPPLSAFDPPPGQGGTFAQGQLTTLTGQTPSIFVNFSVTSLSVVPEPSITLLLASGLLGLALRRSARASTREAG